MITVQDIKLNLIDNFTTLKGFLRAFDGNGASIKSYDYVRKKVKDGSGKKVKYNKFYITRTDVISSKKEPSAIQEDSDLEFNI